MAYDYTKLDDFVATAILSFSNREAKINLMKFNPKNVQHKCAFEICAIMNQIWGYEIRLQMSWFKFLLFKLAHRNVEITRISPKQYITEGPQYNLENHFEKMLSALGYDSSIIEQTYYEYYKKG